MVISLPWTTSPAIIPRAPRGPRRRTLHRSAVGPLRAFRVTSMRGRLDATVWPAQSRQLPVYGDVAASRVARVGRRIVPPVSPRAVVSEQETGTERPRSSGAGPRLRAAGGVLTPHLPHPHLSLGRCTAGTRRRPIAPACRRNLLTLLKFIRQARLHAMWTYERPSSRRCRHQRGH